jgi:uncharacterized OB-fold protein
MNDITDITAATPVPEIDACNAPFWNALKQGRLLFQSCTCGHSWLPPRALCPQCLGTDWEWARSCGQGEIVSWIVYHVAYHPAFKDRVPYNVAIVSLREGPHLITNILDANDLLAVGAQVHLSVDCTQDVPLAQFRLS